MTLYLKVEDLKSPLTMYPGIRNEIEFRNWYYALPVGETKVGRFVHSDLKDLPGGIPLHPEPVEIREGWIKLSDPYVSGDHGTFTYDGTSVRYEDHSRNGTALNYEEIKNKEAPLFLGDVLGFGRAATGFDYGYRITLCETSGK